MKETMYFPCSYPPLGSTFCAVPVLPEIVKPGTAAAAAVPRSLTTPRNALPTWAAVSGEITWRKTVGEKVVMVLPSPVVIDFTMRGVTSLPPLAIVAIATVICNGVTATSWPIGMRVMEILLHDCGGQIKTGILPGHSTARPTPATKQRNHS